MGMTNILLLRRSISYVFSLLKARTVHALERNHRFYSSSTQRETAGERSFTYFIFQDANEAVRFSLLFFFLFSLLFAVSYYTSLFPII